MKRATKLRIGLVFGASLLGLLLVGLVLWFFVIRPMGVGTSTVSAIAALIPFGIVCSAIWWLDRYTPQPKITLAYAFLWGAIGSVVLTLIFGYAVVLAIAFQTNDATVQTFLSTSLQAPIVEELTKALGLVLLLLFGRTFISGPIDGVIYAMLIGTGFAFTENITYFARAFQAAQIEGNSTAFWETFIARGLMSPFAHATFTALVGLGIGIAAERRSPLLYVSLGCGGLGAGMMLHSLWNGLSMLSALRNSDAGIWGFLTYYVIVWVPIFVILAAILAWLRVREVRIVRARLEEYRAAGWLSVDEVAMLSSVRGRRRSLQWASREGAAARLSMKDFHATALSMAAHRQAALSGHSNARIRASEAQLLQRLAYHRRVLGLLMYGPK